MPPNTTNKHTMKKSSVSLQNDFCACVYIYIDIYYVQTRRPLLHLLTIFHPFDPKLQQSLSITMQHSLFVYIHSVNYVEFLLIANTKISSWKTRLRLLHWNHFLRRFTTCRVAAVFVQLI